MGFLHESEPLSWSQAMPLLKYVRDHGLEQFLAIVERCGATQGDPFKWGDEVEHQIFRVTGNMADNTRSAKIVLRSPEILAALKQAEEAGLKAGAKLEETCTWVPEYGRWMVESTPGVPYKGLAGITVLEQQLQLRRERLQAALRPGEVAPTMTHFPLLGVGDFCEPACKQKGPVLKSLFVPDEVVFPHPRFPTLANNIRERRGGNVEIRRPKLKDICSCHIEHAPDFVPQSIEEADVMDHVYADAMPFGMGLSCVQVTMQAANISESRHLYDQLASLTPVLLALSAATPFMRGWICDDDVRWGQISQSVDDRTPAERSAEVSGESLGNQQLAGSGVRPLPKSRYGSIDCYISEREDKDGFNDIPLVFDQAHFERLVAAGVDGVLAQHVAHLFARDPLVIFADRVELDDHLEIDHFENLQSTNWQTLRWKPPPPHKGELSNTDDAHIGWRVEFRSMEVQLTDFENAAFISFVILLSRAILDKNLDLRIPMSKLETNMGVAGRRSAYICEKFWFRTNVGFAAASEAKFEQMTIKDIMQGTGSFAGLVPLCQEYLSSSGCDCTTRQTLERYMSFIVQRAEGKLPTDAKWMRDFVIEHPSYQHDGRVTQAAAHDLILAAEAMGKRLQPCHEVLGSFAGMEASMKHKEANSDLLSDGFGLPSSSSDKGYPSLLSRTGSGKQSGHKVSPVLAPGMGTDGMGFGI
eukprot:TRINITY_DN12150_c0_g2_i2.p1 TRINITY_DN12150_c0_g2~~TRINITY_DN12150_c0_g2_i2.p1  ORF type:complete len:699 (+),score=158.02 TRINITY_DN12150_c0_g2_i2:79-2175(+)